MAEGLSTAAANSALDTLVAAYPYAQLHTAAPGAAGTTAVATESDRVQVTWGSAASATVSNSAQVQWTGVAGSEDYTHITFWSASTAGNFGFSGSVTANAVIAGDTLTIAIGDIDVSLTVAS